MEDERVCAGDECTLHWKQNTLVLGTNTLVLETNALNACVRTSPHTQLATSYFQTELCRDDCYLQVQWVLDYLNPDYPYPDIWTTAHVTMFSAPAGKR